MSAPGFERVVTHIFDAERNYLDSDVQDGQAVFRLEHDLVLVPQR